MTSEEERQKDDCLATGKTSLYWEDNYTDILTVIIKEVEHLQFLHNGVVQFYFHKIFL